MRVTIGPYPEWDSETKTYDIPERQIDVQLDAYDTWSMDHTLALIILPMLKQLKATKHGSPLVDDEDVPEELRSTSAPPHGHDIDDNHHKRWDWVMDEMIWTFRRIAHNQDGSLYFHKRFRLSGEERESRARALDARIANGTRLFGKYYQGLWD